MLVAERWAAKVLQDYDTLDTGDLCASEFMVLADLLLRALEHRAMAEAALHAGNSRRSGSSYSTGSASSSSYSGGGSRSSGSSASNSDDEEGRSSGRVRSHPRGGEPRAAISAPINTDKAMRVQSVGAWKLGPILGEGSYGTLNVER